MKLQDLEKGSSLPGDSGAPLDQPPVWLDRDRFHRGQQFFRKHIPTISFALHCSIAVGYTFPRLIGPLAYTGNTHTPRRALRRFLQTFIHITMWQLGDVWDGKTEAGKSIRTVREMHKRVADAMNSEKSDSDDKQLIISQYDMALVQFSFAGAVILHPERHGITCTRHEVEDYIHLWRGLGYLLGIHDDFNVCSADAYDQTYDLCREIERRVVLPNVLNPPKEGMQMADVYMEGMNSMAFFSLQSKEVVYAHFLECVGLRQDTALSWPDTFRLGFMKLMVYLVKVVPGFEWLLRYYAMSIFRLNQDLADKLPYLKRE